LLAGINVSSVAHRACRQKGVSRGWDSILLVPGAIGFAEIIDESL
jgi:hypothetical protein